jgi:ribosome-binding factor A
MPHRLEQINSNIHHELSQLFSRELEFPTDCIVSISRVKTSEDLRWAQIWISVLPIDRRSKIRNIVNKKKGLLQKHLNKRLRMKPIPRLQFFTDFTEEKAEGIEQTIDKALKEI